MKFPPKGVTLVLAVIVVILFVGGAHFAYKKYTSEYVYDGVQYKDGEIVGAVNGGEEAAQALIDVKDDLKVSGLKTYSNPEYGITFQYPAKYSNTVIPQDADIVLPTLQYKDPSKYMPDFIDVLWLTFKSTDNSEQVLINDVYFDGSGAHPKSFDSFTLANFGYNDFYKIRTGLFEGVLGYKYYLLKEDGAFVFKLTSNNVPWTEPSYNPEKDSRHMDLQEILKTVRLSN